MDKNIIPFDYESNLIRIVKDEEGLPWWVAKDVCRVLKLKDANKAVKNLDDDEKGTTKVRTLGGEQNVITINEPGLYALIIRSNKPEAKKFRRWITHEVLPSIRKTGQYKMAGDDKGGFINGGDIKKAGNMYFPMAKLVESADKYLGGKAALQALNYFTGMPVDDLLVELEEKKLKTNMGSLEWAKNAIEDFLTDECEFGDEFRVQASDIYKAFCSWSRNQGVMKILTQKRFGAVLSASFDREKVGTVHYIGLRLKQAEKIK